MGQCLPRPVPGTVPEQGLLARGQRSHHHDETSISPRLDSAGSNRCSLIGEQNGNDQTVSHDAHDAQRCCAAETCCCVLGCRWVPWCCSRYGDARVGRCIPLRWPWSTKAMNAGWWPPLGKSTGCGICALRVQRISHAVVIASRSMWLSLEVLKPRRSSSGFFMPTTWCRLSRHTSASLHAPHLPILSGKRPITQSFASSIRSKRRGMGQQMRLYQ